MTIKEFEKRYGIRFTTDHSGKMQGMVSLSTSVLKNPICMARSKVPGSICQKCFAAKQAKAYGKNFQDKYAENTHNLTKQIIPVKDFPLLNVIQFRLEAFGDLQNTVQVINYFNLCKRNKRVHFALWTKNPEFIEQAIQAGHKKPSNLVIVQSSSFINKKEEKKYDFIDKVFTVYDKKYIAENKIEINCGARNCFECGQCYSKKTSAEISEQLK